MLGSFAFDRLRLSLHERGILGGSKNWKRIAGGLLFLLGASCSHLNSHLPLPKAGGPIPVNAPRAETPAEHAYWDQLATARVIYIGETHTSNADHEYQFDVLRGLKARGDSLALGWEMFESTQQSLLDAWFARRLSTDALLEKTDFQSHWGTYSVMYEKMLRWSLAEAVPSVALNASAALSHKLAQGQPLDPAERASLPVGYHPLPGGYEHFSEQMTQAPHAGVNLENFYKAQLLWDQTMADRIVAYLTVHPDRKLVVLIGRGHLEGGFGVPAFVSQKMDVPQLVVYPGSAPVKTGTSGSLARNDFPPISVPL